MVKVRRLSTDRFVIYVDEESLSKYNMTFDDILHKGCDVKCIVNDIFCMLKERYKLSNEYGYSITVLALIDVIRVDVVGNKSTNIKKDCLEFFRSLLGISNSEYNKYSNILKGKHLIYSFNSLDNIIDMCGCGILTDDLLENDCSIYSMNDKYYVVISNNSIDAVEIYDSAVYEYGGEMIVTNNLTSGYLDEYGELVVKDKALMKLSKVC